MQVQKAVKVDEELWEEFKDKCRRNGSNIQVVINNFVKQYIKGGMKHDRGKKL